MDYIREVFSALISVIMSISIPDIIDMAILSYLIYHGIKLIRETRATQLIKGIVIICVAYMLSSFFDLKVITFLLKNVFQWGIIAIIILFQPELRRILDKMGRTKVADFTSIFNSNDNDDMELDWNNAVQIIVDAVGELSASGTGALIVCERQTRLGEQIDTGTILNCTPSVEVIENIFFPNTPLHDGAVIVRGTRIHTAGCFLPLTSNSNLSRELGTRHRAALGVSEASDAVVVVVSEETGKISIAINGSLTRNLTPQTLKTALSKALSREDEKEKLKFWRSSK